ncbi:MAG: tail fiber protein [Saprospiraceae bacterium]|nr:tail fiber protein [Saprospiraceae bacterium]
MGESYIGEIRFFAGTFAPVNWLFCDGQKLDISKYYNLFRVIGTSFGGNGSTYFTLPNLCIRAAVGVGQGSGLTNYHLGDKAGAELVTLFEDDMPNHNHPGAMYASSRPPTQKTPGYNLLARGSRTVTMPTIYAPASNPLEKMDPRVLIVEQSGDSVEHNNMQPFLACNFIICYNGTYPTSL